MSTMFKQKLFKQKFIKQKLFKNGSTLLNIFISEIMFFIFF